MNRYWYRVRCRFFLVEIQLEGDDLFYFFVEFLWRKVLCFFCGFELKENGVDFRNFIRVLIWCRIILTGYKLLR